MKYIKAISNELLYFTHALFLTFFLFAGYEMIFHTSTPIDILFGIVVMGYPIYVIVKNMKIVVDQHIDIIHEAYQMRLDKQKREEQNQNKSKLF